MPTFEDPAKDAAELSEAARGLAHATRHFENPADSYRVLGDLQSTLISLHQSLRQVAAFHSRHQAHASTDRGDRVAGQAHAFAAAAWLETAARDIDQATDQLIAAFSANGQIAWQPTAAPEHERLSTITEVLAARAEHLQPGEPGAGGREADPPSVGR